MRRVRQTATGLLTGPHNPHGDGRYIPVLDGWRAVAILTVMVFHGLHTSRLDGSSAFTAASSLSGHVGAMGVLIFFAISGYLITTRLLQDSRQTGKLPLRLFYLRRVFRILPAMAVYLSCIGLLGLTHRIQLERNDWFAPLFLANYFPGSWYTLHFWSLAVEEQFYVLWPLSIALAGWRRALWVGVGIMGVVGAWRGYGLAHLGVSPSDPTYETVRGTFLSHTDARLDYIMAGCVLALLLDFYPGTRRVLERCGSGAGLLCLLLLLGLSASRTRLDLHTPQAILIALIVVGTSLTPSWLADRMLSHPATLFIGKLSYSLYLWQQLLLAPSDSAWLQTPLALPLKFAGAVLAAYLSYRFVERPMIRQGRRAAAHWLLVDEPGGIAAAKIGAV